jgi:hypothetical protein
MASHDRYHCSFFLYDSKLVKMPQFENENPNTPDNSVLSVFDVIQK